MAASKREPLSQSAYNRAGTRQHVEQAPRERTSAKVSAGVDRAARSVRQSPPNLNSK